MISTKRLVGYLFPLVQLVVGCGPTEVIVGDSPGISRVVAGVPGSTLAANEFEGIDSVKQATKQILGEPADVVALPDGSFYFADRTLRLVGFVSPDGRLTWKVGKGECFVPGIFGTGGRDVCLGSPEGLAADPDGNLLIADRLANRVYRYIEVDDRVEVVLGAGAAGSGIDGEVARNARTNQPVDLALDSTGAIYVAEQRNNRVVRITADGFLEIVAGNGMRGNEGDGGPAVEAELANPGGIAVIGDVLYIADTGNNRIRRVENDTIDFYSGQGAAGFAGDGESVELALFTEPTRLEAVGNLLFISDTGNNRIRLVRVGSDTLITFAGTGNTDVGPDLLEVGRTNLAAPTGVSGVDQILYIADTMHSVIRRVFR